MTGFYMKTTLAFNRLIRLSTSVNWLFNGPLGFEYSNDGEISGVLAKFVTGASIPEK